MIDIYAVLEILTWVLNRLSLITLVGDKLNCSFNMNVLSKTLVKLIVNNQSLLIKMKSIHWKQQYNGYYIALRDTNHYIIRVCKCL